MKDRIRTVLRIREIAERRAAGKLAAAEREVQSSREALEERRRAYLARTMPPQPIGSSVLRALTLQGLATHDLVLDAAATHDHDIERRSELAQAWAATSIQRKSAERLSEIRDAALAAHARIAADRAMDEAALLRRRRT